MTSYNDITNQVEFDDNDGDSLPFKKCACGKKFGLWDCILHTDHNDPWECSHCSRKLYFTNKITVYEIINAT